ncbi:hypothetical protein HBN50_02520 [Halobacteriovorax sp. GB3]|uniref:hypothetical protein n=1 Tax=Halobacteriovorax sp. GB3 TaxID=2719615 RepID=UPI002362CF85|nr:hypothetical protein [Halobacteriovorax sp. GB3]MDD0851948.1 hypothetical protein [Halobacteriovorax sp. GB3]
MSEKIETYVDNSEINEVMLILEELEDEQLAVQLLKELNDKTRALGVVLMNMDSSLSHDEWKKECDKAKKEVDLLVKKIKSL